MKELNTIDYFFAGPGREAIRAVSTKTTLKIHDEYNNDYRN